MGKGFFRQFPNLGEISSALITSTNKTYCFISFILALANIKDVQFAEESNDSHLIFCTNLP